MEYLREHRWIAVLLLITAIGGFFRMHHYSDWMHYELDQARDYKVISAAIEKGPGELPLQGPKAAGNVYIDSSGDGVASDKTTLRLGPLFYYMEYISALVFGNSPAGSTIILLILSILTIPLFFFFIREFFRENIALSLTALLASSLFFVVYSRFGWNPNLIPFFSLLTGYSLLQLSKDYVHQGVWLSVASVSFAFLSHMHFLAMTSFGVVAVVYLLWVRPVINWRYWLLAIGIFLTLNLPLIINDVKTGGENYKAFIASVRGSGAEEASVPLKTLIMRNTLEHAEIAWVVLTGDQNIAVPKVKKLGNVSCEDTCKSGLLKTLTVLLYFFAAFVSWFWLLRKTKNTQARNFLRLSGLWALLTFVIYTPLAFDFAPRFFLTLAPLFIVFFGFILTATLKRKTIRNTLILKSILLLVILLNVFFVAQYFLGLKQAQTDSTFELSHEDLILKEKTRITLGQLNAVRDHLIQDVSANGMPIHLHAQAEYKRAIWERITSDVDYPYDGVGDLRTLYREGNYYIVVRSQSDFENAFKNFSENYLVESEISFGTLMLYTLKIKDTIRDGIDPSIVPVFEKRESPVFSSSAQVRYLWRQVFEGCTYSYESKKCEK